MIDAAARPTVAHIRIVVRIAVTVSLLVGALAARQLALPTSAFACSCAAPDPGAPAFTGEEPVVFVGKAGAPQPDGTHEFAVERWFKGGTAAVVRVMSERQVFPDGSTAINTCGLHFEVADRLIMSAGVDGLVLVPGLCSPHAVVDSPEGQRLIAAAIATFGDGSPPGADPGPGPQPDAGPDLALLALAALGLILLLALAAIVLAIARRGPRGETLS